MTTHPWRGVTIVSAIISGRDYVCGYSVAAEETSVTRDCGKKAQADLNCVFEHKNTHQSTLYQIAKIERCRNSRSIIKVSQEC